MIQRGVIGQSVTASVQWGDFDETDPDAPTSTATTVAVTKVDGTAVSGSPFTATRTGIGAYTWALTPLLAAADFLTLVWTAAFSTVSQTKTTYLDVAGAYFSLWDLRGSDPSLAAYSQLQLDAARVRAETDVETIIGFAGVPRVRSERIIADAADWVRPSMRRLRNVRALSVNGTAVTVSTLTVEDQVIRGAWSPRDVIAVSYEHGLDFPPSDLRAATMSLARVRAQAMHSAIPDRAGRYVADSGRTFVLDTPAGGKVGIPEIDSVLARHKIAGIA